MIDNITYNGVRFATYYDEYDVIQVNGDRVVIGIGNTVTAAVNAANIAKDEEIAEAPADAEVPTDIPTQEETENAHGFKVGQKVKVSMLTITTVICLSVGTVNMMLSRLRMTELLLVSVTP